MGNENSDNQFKRKFPNKTIRSEEKLSSFRRNQKGFRDVDSLMFLKDLKEKKEVDALDEKMKLLKSELQGLLGNKKSGGSDYKSPTGRNGVTISGDRNYHKRRLNLNSNTEPEMNFEPKSKPQKTSPTNSAEWLEKPKYETKAKTQHHVEFFEPDDKQINLESGHARGLKKSSLSKSCSRQDLLKSLLASEKKIEKLLYKSFYLQNFDAHLPSPDKKGTNEAESVKTINKFKSRSGKSFKKSNKDIFYQNKKNKCSGAFCNVQKRKRGGGNSFFDSNVELVDLVNHPSSSNVEDLMNMDVSSYDWSEPFEINDTAQFSSDIEILETPKKRTHEIANRPNKNHKPPIKNKSSGFTDGLGQVKSKKSWECPICFEESKDQEVVATRCGHTFCKNCLDISMSKFGKNCPTCRTNLSKSSPIILYNF